MMNRPMIERALMKDVGRNMLLRWEDMMVSGRGERSYQEHRGLVCIRNNMYDIVRRKEGVGREPSVE